MAEAHPYWRTVLLSSVFAVGMTACAFTHSYAQEPPSPPVGTVQQDSYRLPAAVQNFYLDGSAAQHCATVDGRGTTSTDVQRDARILRTTLNLFPMGHAAVIDLEQSGTVLCFENQTFSDASGTVVRNAEFRREMNMFRLTRPDVGQIMHEWKHKHDDIDFNSFEYTPRSAIMLLRVAEGGAYAYEVMARYEARRQGIFVPNYPEHSFLAKIENAFHDTLRNGGTIEEAWRSAFDASFNSSVADSYTDNVLAAYEQASNLPGYRLRDGFASVNVTDDVLMRVALPPGWGTETFTRTGSSTLLTNAFYNGTQLRQQVRLERLETELGSSHLEHPADSHPSPLH
ncbi:MAG: hypothetical protein KDI61_05105 [Alphaproteobacteria bacterium]|nr:hypothetical protein [Alphaproteobacteria bacterium]